MEKDNSGGLSSAKAVLLGALANGVNAPTWLVLKATFFMLGICLIAMLALAFSSRDFVIILHVLLLVIIAIILFTLLNGFLEQTGLVSIEQQLLEIGLSQTENIKSNKKE